MYIKGRVYIWQNQVGNHAYLNGTECVVTGSKQRFVSVQDNQWHDGWPTDTPPHPEHPNWSECLAEPGDLREKDVPSGERKITEMFQPRKLLTMS